MTPWSKVIQPNVKTALGVVLSKECRRLEVGPETVAERGRFPCNAVKAFGRGHRDPTLSELITLAWSLDGEPREFFDKLLTQMHLPPGTRPILNR